MKRLFYLLFLFLSSLLFAMDWPSQDGIITKNFGWNNEGIPHLGVSFSSEGSIEAADDGEIIFRREGKDNASRLPSPLGSWTALDHGDGIISIYGRYSENPVEPVPDKVQKGTVLGEAGSSGWSSAKGYIFQLYDRKERRWINPTLIAPILEDVRPPVIMSVRLRDSGGNLFNPNATRTISQGRYTVIVDAYDSMRYANEPPLAPHRIICMLNGSEAGVLNFETYSARDGSLMVYRNGLVPARQVYSVYPAFEISSVWFSRGQTTLEIIAQDFSGNFRNVIYRLIVE